MYDVVTIGDSFEDIFLFPKSAEIIPDRVFSGGRGLCFGYGDKVDIESIRYEIGGSALNTAVNFQRLGLRSAVISEVGTDASAERILSSLEDFGVETSYIKKRADAGGNLSVILSYLGDRTILTHHGAKDYSGYSPPKSIKTNWFYLAPMGKKSTATENRIIETIAKTAAGLFWNPGSYQIGKGARNYRHLLRFCNLFVVNREEAEKFVDVPGKNSVEGILKILNSFGAKVSVITDGKNGATCYDGSIFYKMPISDDERIDATGAGDSFASAMAANFIRNFDGKKPQAYIPSREVVEQSLKWGMIVSGSVVSKIGAQSGLLTQSELESREKKLIKLQPKDY
ncbi:MAG: carbohydrate kinase family protein [Candidatus Berkelbacteria bacterium]|nr:carbohydrate kinase family protein [Candidatus Berkelbacteria bacterium]